MTIELDDSGKVAERVLEAIINQREEARDQLRANETDRFFPLAPTRQLESIGR